ncbi:barstar family protein [Nonomuraea sp. NEAU-A123]|uniref:barstar family protein n=1 Tax=Nonomuraea sp. NEAU-A123 TaxID=2839649 RepID=UPI001BE46C72|nr:barstar family protein [Nonomuraea sp. NEAU-A123]MBT2224460.1 barstar family protein [Nonomuraea sp. NEAU-A123]
MTRAADFPLYVVLEEESRDVLVAAEEVFGFFVELPESSQEVVFQGIHEVRKGRRRTEDAVLEIVNFRRRKIGEYFIGRAVLGDVGFEAEEGARSRVSYRCFGNRCEYPEAAEIWRRWASDVALLKGEWIQRPMSYQDAWLHVVQNSWFALKRRAARYGTDEVAHLDGAQILTIPGFYCALGEAVNGPGGYFGSNLDALADCMSSDYGEGALVKIVWQDCQASRRSLGDEFLDSIMNLMREFHVQVSMC